MRPGLAEAFPRHEEDAPPTPLEQHGSRAIGAGRLRIQALIHLGSYRDRRHLSLEADDEYPDTEEIAALLRETERTVIELARAEHRSTDEARQGGRAAPVRPGDRTRSAARRGVRVRGPGRRWEQAEDGGGSPP